MKNKKCSFLRWFWDRLLDVVYTRLSERCENCPACGVGWIDRETGYEDVICTLGPGEPEGCLKPKWWIKREVAKRDEPWPESVPVEVRIPVQTEWEPMWITFDAVAEGYGLDYKVVSIGTPIVKKKEEGRCRKKTRK